MRTFLFQNTHCRNSLLHVLPVLQLWLMSLSCYKSIFRIWQRKVLVILQLWIMSLSCNKSMLRIWYCQVSVILLQVWSVESLFLQFEYFILLWNTTREMGVTAIIVSIYCCRFGKTYSLIYHMYMYDKFTLNKSLIFDIYWNRILHLSF